MLERFERDVLSIKPRAVIIWGFINDVFRADPTQMDTVLERVRQSYVRMIALARERGVEPILATEVTIRPVDSWSEMVLGPVGRLLGKESHTDRINRHVMDINRWLVTLANQERLLLLDLSSALSQPDGRRRREFAMDDGSHITPAGYAALSGYARPMLEAHLQVQGGGR
jgi:lysophospholipase L1-like esterase